METFSWKPSTDSRQWKWNLPEQMRYLIWLKRYGNQLWKDLDSKVSTSKIKVIKTWKYIKSKKTFAANYIKKNIYSETDTRKITDKKTFWKTITPFISSKAPSLSTITRIENEAIISDDQNVAETLSKFFVKVVDKLDIKEFKKQLKHWWTFWSSGNCYKEIWKSSLLLLKLLLIKTITERFNFVVRFEFEKVNLKDIEKEILNLDIKKPLRQIASRLKYLKKRLKYAALCFSRYGMMKL